MIWLIVVVGALVAALWAGDAASATQTVHLRGTAYEFNNTHTLLAGATIRVAEFPALKATVQQDGQYDLTVPDHARVTPYIVKPGYHTIYLQTFTTDGEDLANVNFQTPTEQVYQGLVALLHVPVDANGNLTACAIVSTFNTRNVRDLSFNGFTAYGAHGVAGATATASPSLGRPTYFNQNVIPDPTQTSSSVDGGVVWTNVPAGVYTITAHDPATRFASFVATCRPGRVVNANPPWGLHQLGLRNPAQVTAHWSVSRTGAALATSLTARRLPTGSVIRVSCSGRGCRFASRTFRPGGSAFDIGRALGGGTLELSPGESLEVSVSAHRFNSVVDQWVARSGHVPRQTTLCVPLGDSKPLHHCPSSR
jgi:hypothetical protein